MRVTNDVHESRKSFMMELSLYKSSDAKIASLSLKSMERSYNSEDNATTLSSYSLTSIPGYMSF